ncbi:hypothetical protein FACS1894139_15780 [Planctomycetales bacterium]|nr:hypothetical protein FACS1894107_13150 [Planctomycetales bacterium]GHT07451.1 hypothetical protein FACS1894139_15780 [Planctomycetales bacterium]
MLGLADNWVAAAMIASVVATGGCVVYAALTLRAASSGDAENSTPPVGRETLVWARDEKKLASELP